MKQSKKSRMLELVHKTATDLYEIGLIDKRKMEKYDLLCEASSGTPQKKFNSIKAPTYSIAN